MNRRFSAKDGSPDAFAPPEAPDESGKLFEELALPALDDLYRFACRLEGDPARAADLLQESLLIGFRKFHQFSGSSFRAWMATILRRTFFNQRRRIEPTVPLEPAATAQAELGGCDVEPRSPDERLLGRRLSREIRAALDELPGEQRLAVFLVDVLGFTYAEAAVALGVPAGTAASRVARARGALRKRLHHLARERGWIR